MQSPPPCCNNSGQPWMQIKVVIFLRFPQTCHEDCKKREKSKFAKQCAKDGGLFKCCIRWAEVIFQQSILILDIPYFRRDKEYCHECRYCCTLSVCTTEEGSRYIYTNKSLAKVEAEGLQHGAPTAIAGFSTDMPMWKNYDFRCLKPKEGVSSEMWPHYEMQKYRVAKTEKELDEVEEIPFDVNFFNIEDPKVLNKMTNGKKSGLELWKKTYGFDWADYVNGSNSTGEDFKRRQHCLDAEYGKFAKDCKKKGGFFKCCSFA